MADDGHSFDLATAVAGGPERWTARVDEIGRASCRERVYSNV